jgi:hypothetical protein
VQSADKPLYVGAAHGMVGGVALRLHIAMIQAKSVLPDHTVNSTVAGTGPMLSRTGPAAVAHRGE